MSSLISRDERQARDMVDLIMQIRRGVDTYAGMLGKAPLLLTPHLTDPQSLTAEFRGRRYRVTVVEDPIV